MKYALRGQERIDLIQEVGANGLLLFEYYLRMASIENIEITDQDAANYFGWNIHTAKRWRRALTKAGWYASEQARASTGTRIFLYYLGKEEVAKARNQ